MICAGVTGGGKDACSGDEGDLLVVGGQLIGIVSWGIGSALADYPGVYSNVATLKSFVTEQTGLQQDADVTRCHLDDKEILKIT